MAERRTAYEVAVQDRSTLHYYIGLIVRWKQQWKYKYARWLARKNGATIGEGVIMPLSLAKRANKNLKVGNHVSIQTDKLDIRNSLSIGNQVVIRGGYGDYHNFSQHRFARLGTQALRHHYRGLRMDTHECPRSAQLSPHRAWGSRRQWQRRCQECRADVCCQRQSRPRVQET